MNASRLGLALLLGLVLFAGCGSKDEPRVVEGLLFVQGGVVSLCDAIAESYPPQCAGDQLVVKGLDLASVPGLQTAQGVSWTERGIRLRGIVRDGVLAVSENAIA